MGRFHFSDKPGQKTLAGVKQLESEDLGVTVSRAFGLVLTQDFMSRVSQKFGKNLKITTGISNKNFFLLFCQWEFLFEALLTNFKPKH